MSQLAKWVVPLALLIIVLIVLPHKSVTDDAVYVKKTDLMEELRTKNPEHYEKIQRILAGLDNKSDYEIPRWIQTGFDATEVELSSFLLTSYPPKKNLSFVIDNKRYQILIVR